MRHVRRGAAALVASLLLATLMSGPAAAADTPERFVGNAAGQALRLDVLGQSVTLGAAKTKMTSLLDPVATAAGQLVPQLFASTSTAGGTSGLTRDPESGEKCALPALPEPLGSVVDLGLACSQAEAIVDGTVGRASGQGSVASLGLDASTVLSQLDALPIQDVVDTVDGTVVGPLLDQLAQVSPEVANTVDTSVDTLTDLIDDVLHTKLLDAGIGVGTSSVVTEVGKVTSSASARGADIKILPLTQALGLTQPLAQIIVGSSSATASYDRGLGKAVADFDAALVTVKLAPLPGLLPSGLTQSIAPGQTLTILEGTPLESTISVADGRTYDLPDGGVGAVADGVSLHLLKGIAASSPTARDGGILLQLAHSEADVAGAPAVTVPVTNNPTVAGVQQLPRTGGTPWIPMAGVGILALAVIGRRVAVRTR